MPERHTPSSEGVERPGADRTDMLGLTKDDWKGLWAVVWRLLILGPIIGIVGLALLLLVTGVFVGLPIYSVSAFFSGDWSFGVAAFMAWLVALRFGRPLLRWTFDGFEHTGI